MVENVGGMSKRWDRLYRKYKQWIGLVLISISGVAVLITRVKKIVSDLYKMCPASAKYLYSKKNSFGFVTSAKKII